jgi:hypothetical protein
VGTLVFSVGRAVDHVVRFDGVVVSGIADLHRTLKHDKINRAVVVEIIRKGSPRQFTLEPREAQGRSK